MELTDEQIEILQMIHDAENHGIDGNEIPRLKIEFPNLDDDLQKLIEGDLVEYELREDKYYLGYDGFEQLENKVKFVRQKTDIEQYQEIVETFGGAKQFQKITLLGLLIVAVFVCIFLYLNPEISNFNKRNDMNIDESIFNQIKIELQEKLDSIQDSQNLKQIGIAKDKN